MRKLFSRDTFAQLVELAGAAAVAFGVGLIYLPAGVIIAGVAGVAWAMLVFDTGGDR